MAAMDGPNPALALQLLEQIRGQFPGSRRADRLTVHLIQAPSTCACASHLQWNSSAFHTRYLQEGGDGAAGLSMSAGICACLCTI